MELTNPQAALLSNYEVQSLINEMQTTKTGNQEASQLATIMYETSHYLQELPCKDQNAERIERLLTLLVDFPIALTKLEKLMICNDPPTSTLQLSLIVKDCEEKLSESEMKSWLKKMQEALNVDSGTK